MSFVRPIDEKQQDEQEADRAGPLDDANGTRRPRTFSTRLQKMWPPSSGRNGKRLMTPSERLIDGEHEERLAGRRSSIVWLSDVAELPTTPESCLRCSGSKIRANVETVFEVTNHIWSTAQVAPPRRATGWSATSADRLEAEAEPVARAGASGS